VAGRSRWLVRIRPRIRRLGAVSRTRHRHWRGRPRGLSLRLYSPSSAPDIGEEEFAVILRGYADFLRTSRPPEEPSILLKGVDRTLIRGVLAMSDDELSVVIRDNNITFPGPTAESESESRLEARLEAVNEAIDRGLIEVVIEAFESGAIGRKKPGRKPRLNGTEQDDKYLALWRKCVDVCRGDTDRARIKFFRDGPEKLNVTEGTMRNALSRLKRMAAK
jgi:hypothetical protein